MQTFENHIQHVAVEHKKKYKPCIMTILTNKPNNLETQCDENQMPKPKRSISYCIPVPDVQAPPLVQVPLLPLTPLLAIAPRSK